MNTSLRAVSLTLRELLTRQLSADTNLRPFFDTGAGGTMAVTLLTPQEMSEAGGQEGLSIWLYWVERDEQTLNTPPRRRGRDQMQLRPLPLKLHYLATPIVNNVERTDGPELEQNILGAVLQFFHDHAILQGADLRSDLTGSGLDLHVRLEPLDLEQIARVWDALERSFQLCVSYEVSVVPVDSARAPIVSPPVDVVSTEFGVATLEEDRS